MSAAHVAEHTTHNPPSCYLIDIRQTAAPRVTGDATARLTGGHMSHLWVSAVCNVHLCKIGWKLRKKNNLRYSKYQTSPL